MKSARTLPCARFALKNVGAGDIGKAFGQLEVPMRPVTSRVDNTLGNALMIEVENLFPKVEIFKQGRAARANSEGVLVIGDGNTLLRCQRAFVRICSLMELAALPAIQCFSA